MQRAASARLAEWDARVDTALQSGRHTEELDIPQEDEDELPRTASHTTSGILILIQTPNPLWASRADQLGGPTQTSSIKPHQMRFNKSKNSVEKNVMEQKSPINEMHDDFRPCGSSSLAELESERK